MDEPNPKDTNAAASPLIAASNPTPETSSSAAAIPAAVPSAPPPGPASPAEAISSEMRSPALPPPPPPPKPMREDIASIIDKIKLPERLTVKISGEKPKSPPDTAPPTVETIPPSATPAAASETPAISAGPTADYSKAERENPVSSVHTLKDDLQNVVRDKKMSLVRAVALESEKKRGQEHLIEDIHINTPRSRKIMGLVFSLLIFLALTLVAYFGARTILSQNASNAQQSAAPSFIFTEKSFLYPKDTREGMDLKRAIASDARDAGQVPLGAIVQIIPVAASSGEGEGQHLSIGEFLWSIGAQASQELIRALSASFFLGFHQIVGKFSPVIIIPVASYERAFAGMLEWETTMNADLAPIFAAVPPQTTNELGALVERRFQDELINNYDVRVLRDDSGAIQMLYSFPTRTMLIIAESPYSFTESLSRLRASRRL